MGYLVDGELTGKEMLRPLGDAIEYHDGRLPKSVPGNPSAVFLRSVTTWGEDELNRFPSVREVYTATAGMDHIDEEACAQRNVTVYSAPGHNAESVADWVVVALSLLSAKKGEALEGKRLGIVGVGNAGSAVARRARTMGLLPVFHDPPRALREGAFVSAPFDEMLECDVVSFHVPLTRNGAFSTAGMFALEQARSDQWVINASRGEVLGWSAGAPCHAAGLALDVFPGEPHISPRWASRADFCTPHVAGNTHEAKWLATEMLFHQALIARGQKPPSDPLSARMESPTKPPQRGTRIDRLDEWTGLVSLSNSFRLAIAEAKPDRVGECFKAMRKQSRRWLLPEDSPLRAPSEFFQVSVDSE